MSDLGNLLKSTREEQKKTIKDVVDDTRIRENFINIIEEGRLKDLPSYLHAYGFVKKYAEFLNLDYNNVVWPLFSQEYPKDGVANQSINITKEEYTPSTTEISFLENDKKNNKSVVVLILLVIILLGIGYGGYYLYTSDVFGKNNSVENDISLNADTTVPVTVVEPETTVTFTNDNNSYIAFYDNTIYADNSSNNIASNENDSNFIDPLFTQTIPTPVILSPEKVKVRFSENCWFKYITDKGQGNEINARNGTEIEIEFDKTFKIEIGNAIAVSLEYNGQRYSNFGSRNTVRILTYEALDGKLELIRR